MGLNPALKRGVGLALLAFSGHLVTTAEAAVPSNEWYAESRVHAHTRFGLQYKRKLGPEDYERAMRAAQDLGARVIVAHAKTAAESPSWEENSEPTNRSVPAMIKAAHAQTMRFIAYYWISSEERIAKAHPDWICRDARGRPQSHRRRGEYLDFTGPYREVVLKRLLALAEMGADGFYFDGRHLPEAGCWGSTLATAFRKETGLAPPRHGDKTSATFGHWQDFKARRVAETFRYWADAVRAKHPGVAFVISVSALAGLTTREFHSSIAEVAYSKTEFINPERQQFNKGVFRRRSGLMPPPRSSLLSFGWSLLRDAGSGRPPHIWAPAVPDREHALGYVAATIGAGGIANLDVAEETLLTGRDAPGHTPREALVQAFELGNRLSAVLRGAEPAAWAGIHFSERARDKAWPDYAQAWRRAILPAVATYDRLTRLDVPVRILTDNTASHTADLDLLALPAESPGTALTAPGLSWPSAADGALPPAVLSRIEQTAPVRILAPTGSLRSSTFVRRGPAPALFVVINGDFSWIKIKLPGLRLSDEPPAARRAAPDFLRVRFNRSSVARMLGTSARLRAADALSGTALREQPDDSELIVKLPNPTLPAVLVVSPIL